MSSHHFVREGQEPALFIVEASSLNNIASLLEWAPLVMVRDTALEQVLSWGVKIDAVVAGLNNVASVEALTHEQFPLQIFSYRHDENAVAVGLKHLLHDQKAVHVMAPATNHTFAVLEAFCDLINVVVVDDALRWVPVRNRFEKWLPAKTLLTVRRDDAQRMDHRGVIERKPDLFEVNVDGHVKIESDNAFWVGEIIH